MSVFPSKYQAAPGQQILWQPSQRQPFEQKRSNQTVDTKALFLLLLFAEHDRSWVYFFKSFKGPVGNSSRWLLSQSHIHLLLPIKFNSIKHLDSKVGIPNSTNQPNKIKYVHMGTYESPSWKKEGAVKTLVHGSITISLLILGCHFLLFINCSL